MILLAVHSSIHMKDFTVIQKLYVTSVPTRHHFSSSTEVCQTFRNPSHTVAVNVYDVVTLYSEHFSSLTLPQHQMFYRLVLGIIGLLVSLR